MAHVTNTLFEDFGESLPNVQRNWLRRGSVIILFPLIAIVGAISTGIDWVVENWNYRGE